jgi:hypothetical protein
MSSAIPIFSLLCIFEGIFCFPYVKNGFSGNPDICPGFLYMIFIVHGEVKVCEKRPVIILLAVVTGVYFVVVA